MILWLCAAFDAVYLALLFVCYDHDGACKWTFETILLELLNGFVARRWYVVVMLYAFRRCDGDDFKFQNVFIIREKPNNKNISIFLRFYTNRKSFDQSLYYNNCEMHLTLCYVSFAVTSIETCRKTQSNIEMKCFVRWLSFNLPIKCLCFRFSFYSYSTDDVLDFVVKRKKNHLMQNCSQPKIVVYLSSQCIPKIQNRCYLWIWFCELFNLLQLLSIVRNVLLYVRIQSTQFLFYFLFHSKKKPLQIHLYLFSVLFIWNILWCMLIEKPKRNGNLTKKQMQWKIGKNEKSRSKKKKKIINGQEI